MSKTLDFLENNIIFQRSFGACVSVSPFVFSILKDISINEDQSLILTFLSNHNIDPEYFFQKLKVDFAKHGIIKRS